MTDPRRDRLRSSLGAAYTLEREIGGSGMSRVFLAEDAALGRRIVVKVLAPELAEGLSAERFTREVRLAARLQHPNVVPVHAAGTGPDGLPYYTMPFIDGASLRELTGGAAVVADFGLAKALSAAGGSGATLTQVGMAVGTPAYMAPEQAAGDGPPR